MSLVEPFLRWTGGKRWLGPVLSPVILKYAARYFEPFLGSGSIFFSLGEQKPRRVILSDINRELITAFQVVQKSPDELSTALCSWEATRETYDIVRNLRSSQPLEIAARFIYLNRTSFNGLYRVNRKGEFNVPFGGRNLDGFLKRDVIAHASSALKGARIVSADFENILNKSKECDFIYCDPAYTVSHNNNGFLRYNESVFSWGDQERLRDAALEAKTRGTTVVISNAYHDSLCKLYWPFRPIVLNRPSMIGNSSVRGSVSEALFVITEDKSVRETIQRRVAALQR